jgi:anti-sigma regulatory factor (Ser/Thr protein kinase)
LPTTCPLPVDPRSPSLARHFIDASGVVPSSLIDRVKLVVSELVTNAVKHSGMSRGDIIELRLLPRPDVVRVEVRDSGRGLPAEAGRGASLSELQAFGRGLYVVSQVADRWGADPSNGATVWAEFDVDLAA